MYDPKFYWFLKFHLFTNFKTISNEALLTSANQFMI